MFFCDYGSEENIDCHKLVAKPLSLCIAQLLQLVWKRAAQALNLVVSIVMWSAASVRVSSSFATLYVCLVIFPRPARPMVIVTLHLGSDWPVCFLIKMTLKGPLGAKIEVAKPIKEPTEPTSGPKSSKKMIGVRSDFI